MGYFQNVVTKLSPPLGNWLQANGPMIVNAVSLVGTQAVTSLLGFAYWWLAAQFYSPTAVGIASTAISAMLLLGNIGVFGFGTLLVGEIAERQMQVSRLVATAIIVVSVIAGVLGLLFAVTAGFLANDLSTLAEHAALFAAGVILSSIALVVDHSTIGLHRGELQLWRNALFAAAKLGILFLAAAWLSSSSGIDIYATWTLGVLVSLLIALGYALSRGLRFRDMRPEWSILGGLRRLALGHHVLNLAIQVPRMVLPVLITALFSAEVTASYYVAWMITSLVMVVPAALSTSLYAAVAKEPTTLVRRLWLSLIASLAIGIGANVVLIFGARPLLRLFGASYVEAEFVLRILALEVFPYIPIIHYVAITRVRKRLGKAALLMTLAAILQLMMAIVGGMIGNDASLSIGYVLAVGLTALIIIPTVYRELRP